MVKYIMKFETPKPFLSYSQSDKYKKAQKKNIFQQNIIIFIAEASCTSPNYIEGTCVDIRECKFISDLVRKKNRTVIESSFLRNSECGRDGPTNIKVCCEPEVPPQVYDMPVSQTICYYFHRCFRFKNIFLQSIKYINIYLFF